MEGERSGLLTIIRMVLRRKSGTRGSAPLCFFLLIPRWTGLSVALQREASISQYRILCLSYRCHSPELSVG